MATLNAIGTGLPIQIEFGGTGANNASDARANLGVQLGGRTITGTVDQIVVTNGSGIVGNPILSIATDPVMPGVGSITAPVGTTDQQPVAPALGMMRGNTDTNNVEFYCFDSWNQLPVQPVTISHLYVNLPYASAVSATSDTPTDLLTLSLTPGTWELSGNVFFTGDALDAGLCWISTTSASYSDYSHIGSIVLAGAMFNQLGLVAPDRIITVASNTTVYLGFQANFETGSATACGSFIAKLLTINLT